MAGDYLVKALNLGGTALGTLTPTGDYASRVNRYGWVRNGIGEAEIVASNWDTQLGSLFPCGSTLTNEVGIYRDTVRVWRGLVVPAELPSLSGQQVRLRCFGLEWPFTRLCFGKASRDNLLTNGGFESHAVNLTGWTTVDTTSSIETSIINSGARAAKLDGAGHITQTASGITHSYDPGLAPRLAAYVYLPATVADEMGDGWPIARLVANDGSNEYTETITVGDVDRFDVYTRVSTDILLAADATWSVEVRLEGSDEDPVYWDDVLLTFNDAVTVAYPGDDMTVLVENIVSHLQDTGFGKVDLGYTVDPTASGIDVLKGYAYSDHEFGWPVLQDLAREYDADIWVDDDKVWHVRAKRGSARSALNKSITATSAAQFRAMTDLDIALTVDPSETATSVILIGEASDFAREEAGASSPGIYGGRVLESVIHAPPSAKVRDLQPQADAEVARRSRVPMFPSIGYRETGTTFIGTVYPGDTATVEVNAGWLQIPSSTLRAETVTVDVEQGGAGSELIVVAWDQDL